MDRPFSSRRATLFFTSLFFPQLKTSVKPGRAHIFFHSLSLSSIFSLLFFSLLFFPPSFFSLLSSSSFPPVFPSISPFIPLSSLFFLPFPPFFIFLHFLFSFFFLPSSSFLPPFFLLHSPTFVSLFPLFLSFSWLLPFFSFSFPSYFLSLYCLFCSYSIFFFSPYSLSLSFFKISPLR